MSGSFELQFEVSDDSGVADQGRDRSPMVCGYDQAMSLTLDLLDQSPADSSPAATWAASAAHRAASTSAMSSCRARPRSVHALFWNEPELETHARAPSRAPLFRDAQQPCDGFSRRSRDAQRLCCVRPSA